MLIQLLAVLNAIVCFVYFIIILYTYLNLVYRIVAPQPSLVELNNRQDKGIQQVSTEVAAAIF